MAAQFPSNLDNGEIYHFPPDIFFNDKIFSKCTPRHLLDHPHHHHHHHHHHHQQLCRHQLSCIDDLAHHLTALSMLQRQTLAKPQTQIPHNFELFTPTVRTGTVIPQLLPDSFRANGNGGRQLELVQRLQEYGIGSFSSFESKPGYDLQFMKPTPAQLETFLEERASRVLQGQHVQTRNRSLNQNRKMPFSGSGFVLKGGFARESGGTGVFHPHPRINDNASNTTSTATVAKKQIMAGLRDSQGIQFTQQRKSAKRPASVSTNKHNHHPPQEMSLPNEWTY
ncbi:hypothetical protein KPL70_018427 [Citrus sinensis]|uniref:uncharacterized protein LOC102623077 isoform X1 n=1 Tax=Citrus sinensis TaxID=2711 RepID=UPI0003D708B1|nr:uncharacterized protein LOC102623077 isoform X1 [Citrus sinensis]KAH9674377.1 hypothetical protein KPL70_018427 [Citrus sinensis]